MQQRELTKIEIIDTDKIVVVMNPRNDYGDIDGLAADISAGGLGEPLQLNVKHELVDGHRRLATLKLNKARTAPCIIEPGLTPSMTEEIKLVTIRSEEHTSELQS